MTRLERRFPRAADLAPLLTLKPRERDRTARRLADAHSIGDLRRIARRRTPSGPFDYADGAADGEVGLRRVREAFDDLEFRPGVLRDVSAVDTSTTVLGARSALPFASAPTGFTRMLHAAGERAVAAAAAAADIPFSLSTVGTTSIEQIAQVAPTARKWFQLYLTKDRELSARLVSDAAAAGYEVLIVTVDVPVGGRRLRDLHNGMTIPPRLSARTFLDASYRIGWWFDFLTTDPYSFAFDPNGRGSTSQLIGRITDPSVDLDDLAWLRQIWRGPLVVKGVQTVDDARTVVDHGADGVVVSSHGGRQLDRAPVPLHVLPDVVNAVGQRATVMLDTGITHGADIVAALAAGADFTLVGRALLYGLMAGGEPGVTRSIDILRTEMENTMKLVGVSSVEELEPGHVRLLSRRSLVHSEERQVEPV